MDDNLQSVADIVNTEIAADASSDVGSGAQTQQELDTQNAAAVEEPVKPVETPVTPAEGFQAQQPPVTQTPTPIKAGDTVAPSTPPAAAAAPNDAMTARLEEIFPGRGFKSLDDVKAADINGSLTRGEEAALKITELNTSNDDYKAKLNAKLNPFANQEMAEMNAFVKETGINDASLFKSIKGKDLATIDPLDMMVMKERKDNPDLTETEVRDYLKHKYNLNPKPFDHILDEEEKADAIDRNKEEIRIATIALKRDANGARTEFAELQEKIKPVDMGAQMEANKVETDKRIADATDSWNPHIAQSVEGVRNFPINLPGEDGASKTVATFAVPQEKLQEYTKMATDFAVNQHIPANDEGGRMAVNKFISDMVLIDFKDQIIQKAISATKAGMELQTDKEISNASGTSLPPNPGDAKPVVVNKTVDQLEDEAAAGAMDILNEGKY